MNHTHSRYLKQIAHFEFIGNKRMNKRAQFRELVKFNSNAKQRKYINII